LKKNAKTHKNPNPASLCSLVRTADMRMHTTGTTVGHNTSQNGSDNPLYYLRTIITAQT